MSRTPPRNPAETAPERARLDLWLWRARFFRTRGLAAAAAAKGLRVNGRRIAKPGAAVRAGDVLTFAQAGRIRVIEVAALGERRGPAPEARALYIDRDPQPGDGDRDDEDGDDHAEDDRAGHDRAGDDGAGDDGEARRDPSGTRRDDAAP